MRKLEQKVVSFFWRDFSRTVSWQLTLDWLIFADENIYL
jgi:hypothetical protein